MSHCINDFKSHSKMIDAQTLQKLHTSLYDLAKLAFFFIFHPFVKTFLIGNTR